jgi:hypothetical protein
VAFVGLLQYKSVLGMWQAWAGDRRAELSLKRLIPLDGLITRSPPFTPLQSRSSASKGTTISSNNVESNRTLYLRVVLPLQWPELEQAG